MTPESVTFHVGLPKTGTTYLQNLLWLNRRALAASGLRYPGADPGAQWLAALDLRGFDHPPAAGAWDSLVAEVMREPAAALVSHEMFAGVTPAQASQIVQAVGRDRLRIVVTLRDLSRIVPTTWQERAKNRLVEPWPEFVEGVSRGPEGGHNFWLLQDAAGVLRTWSALLPSEQITVVTVPPPGAPPELLLRRMASAIGFDPAVCVRPSTQANESIGAVEVAVLQRLNAAAADLDFESYHTAVKRFVVPEHLAGRPDRCRVALSEANRGWVAGCTETVRETVGSIGCRVVGDLDDLEPAGLAAGEVDGTTTHPETVSPDDVLARSAGLAVALAQEVVTLRAQLARQNRPVAVQPPRPVASRARNVAVRVYRRLRSRTRAGSR